LKKSLIADYVVLGGGNAKKLDELPEGIERGPQCVPGRNTSLAN
jgi:hypothetical protein